MLKFKCLKGLAPPTCFVAFCTKGSTVSGQSASRSAVRGDLVVPGHRTDWGLQASAVSGHSFWSVEFEMLLVLVVGMSCLLN